VKFMATGTSIWQKIRKGWAILGSLALVVFVGWCLSAFRATGEAKDALAGDDLIPVVRGDGYWFFTPTDVEGTSPLGFVFFPGALVDPAAYAPLTRAVALAGYPALLVDVPRRSALGGADGPEVIERAIRGMQADPGAVKWVIAGHSRGGAIASRFVHERNWRAAGLILIGTSHPRDFSLAHVTLPTMKILGSLDRISPPEKSEANRHLLPKGSKWMVIPGGNHSQFGWYGLQPGDRFATIGRELQQQAMIEAVLKTMETAARAGRSPFKITSPDDV
jgi:pimeloyl-ACP methyl ester carboxylesterase